MKSPRINSNRLRALAAVAILFLLASFAPQRAQAASPAADNPCNGGVAITNGNNSGYGFDAWTNLIVNGGGYYYSGTGIPDDVCSGHSWGIFSSGDNVTSAQRPLTNYTALSVNQTITVDLANGGIDSGGSEGMSFYSPNGGTLWEFFYANGNTGWTIQNGGSVGTTVTSTVTTVPYVADGGGGRVIFTLTSPTNYSVTVQTNGNGNTTSYGPFTGVLILTNTVSSSGTNISQLRFFTFDIGSGNNMLIGQIGVTCSTPTFTTQPVSIGACPGSTASFTAVSTNAASPTYQWQFSSNGGGSWINVTNGTGGATTNYTTVATTSGMNGYEYQCVLTDACGDTTTSSVATLTVTATVNAAGPITGLTTVCANQTGVSYTTPNVTGASGYAWTVPAGASITAGANTTNITVTFGTTPGNVIVTPTNACATGTPSTNAVTVSPASAGGTVSASASSLCLGGSVTLTNTGYTGTIQWETATNGGSYSSISGATGATYVTPNLTNTTSSNVIYYYYAAVTSGVCSTANSTTNAITVSPAPVGGTATAAINNLLSGLSTTITLSGDTGTIQWQGSVDDVNFTNISGATGATYVTPNLTNTTSTNITYYYTVVTTGACSSSTSSVAAVTVSTGPSITAGPTNAAVWSGATTNFAVTAAGTSLSYAWYQNANLGWGSAWTVVNETNGTIFLGSSTDNDNGAPSCNSFSGSRDINTPSGDSWGLYGPEQATRTFPAALTNGQVFQMDMDNGLVNSGLSVGFSLHNSANALLFSFYFTGGGSDYVYYDGTGAHTTSVPYTVNGLQVTVIVGTGTNYTLLITPCGGSTVEYPGSFATTGAPDNVLLYNNNTSEGSSAYNLYFNSLYAGLAHDDADNYTNVGNWSGFDMGDALPISGATNTSYSTASETDSAYYAVAYNDIGAAVSTNAILTVLVPPVIVNVQPANGAFFVNPATNVSFEVDSPSPNLLGTNVTLLLNGVTQTLVFNTSGVTEQLLATNTTPLATNVQYSATIIAVDLNGNSATNNFSFNTTQTNSLWRDVDSYGAVGDGVTTNTAAIQAAINACPSNGFVWLHNGTFLSGTIFLTNNMTLFIDQTATLLGSGSPNSYPILNPPANDNQQANCDMALVYAQSCTNVTVTGGGTINGNGRTNFTSGVEATRPISVWTVLCKQVNLQYFHIVDAAMWTMVNMESDNLTINNVTVNDDGLNGNRDGCDVVDCWNVLVENCTIDSGDDSICLKSGNSRGVNNVLVQNCTITKSQSNGLKLGTATTGMFTNITFQNCTVMNTAHSAMAVESVDGGAISDVTFQGINFSGCQNAIFIILGSRDTGVTPGSVNGITYKNITGSNMTDTRGCPISGTLTNGVTYMLGNILFDNVNISFAGGLDTIPAAPPEYDAEYPENTMWGDLPAYGYYIRHATNVTFTNCFTSAASPDARPWIATDDVSNLTIIGPAPSITAEPTNATVCSGSPATFAVTAAGESLSYAWYQHANLGWGNAWTAVNETGGSIFLGNSTNTDNGAANCDSFSSYGNINTSSGESWGLYGGTTGEQAQRTFPAALTNGQVFQIEMDNGFVNTGQSVGFSLHNSASANLFSFFFTGGGNDYVYYDSAGAHTTSVPYTQTGLRVTVIVGAGTNYTLQITPCGGSTAEYAGGFATTGAPDMVLLYNNNTNGAGSAYNLYFNSLYAGLAYDDADNYTNSGNWSGVDAGDAAPISGATNASYSTTGGTNGSLYYAVVNNSFGAAVSSTATLTVNPTPMITFGASPVVAYGSISAPLPYTGTTGSPDQYSIAFDTNAQSAGFANVTPTTLPGSPIAVTVPATATVGTYTGAVTVLVGATGCNSSVPFTVTINQQTPTLTAPTASAITYGQTLTSSTLSGGAATNSANNAAVAGGFAFTAPLTAPGAGTPIEPVTFSPTDTTDYTPATSSVPVTVNPAPLSITANNASKVYGQTLTFAGTEFTTSGLTNSDSVTSVTLTSAGATNTAPVSNYPIIASAAMGSGLTNYNITYNNGTLTVTAPTPVIINRPVLLGDGAIQLTFSGGDAGVSYLIQASTNLATPIWSTLGTNVAGTNGLPGFIDMGATNYPIRFYQTVTP
jgi:polygalacturonase